MFGRSRAQKRVSLLLLCLHICTMGTSGGKHTAHHVPVTRSSNIPVCPCAPCGRKLRWCAANPEFGAFAADVWIRPPLGAECPSDVFLHCLNLSQSSLGRGSVTLGRFQSLDCTHTFVEPRLDEDPRALGANVVLDTDLAPCHLATQDE